VIVLSFYLWEPNGEDRATFLLLSGHLGGEEEEYWEFIVAAREGVYTRSLSQGKRKVR
jgi:hypothetical protein